MLLYRSKLKTGLFQFKKHDDSISETVDPESLKVSPTGWKTVTKYFTISISINPPPLPPPFSPPPPPPPSPQIILVTQDVRYMYVSNDAGHSWSRHDLPDIVFNPFRDIMMSSISPSHMALVSTFGKVCISFITLTYHTILTYSFTHPRIMARHGLMLPIKYIQHTLLI